MRRFLPLAIVLLAACSGGGGASDPTPTPTPTGTQTPTPPATPTPTALCAATPDAQFPATWIDGDGGDCATEPDFQVHRYDPNTFIVRQSLCTNFEGPFVYLLFGDDKVLLEDTGASTNVDFKGMVDGIIAQVLAERGQASIELVVASSHGHVDHVANNGAFSGQQGVTVVGSTVAANSTFFGITSWPTQIVSYDLGNRVLDVLPIPGHQTAHIALYDRNTGILLTGDTLYPGRLYIAAGQFAVYQASIQRLVDFTATREVCHVLGTHIEMSTTAQDDFPAGSDYHPSEHRLRLTRDHLLELDAAVDAMAANPQIEPHDDFIVYPF